METYNIDGEILTEDQVLSRIQKARKERAEVEKEIERRHKERWLRERHRLLCHSQTLLDMAHDGRIDQDKLREAIVCMTGLLFES